MIPLTTLNRRAIVNWVFVFLLTVFSSIAALPSTAYSESELRAAPFLDVVWYRENLLLSADLWNGGLDGQSGMGAYREDFSGFFHVNLDQQWHQLPMESSTSVAQSRAIYMNVEAYRVAGPEEGARFLQAVNQGVEFLLTYFKDAKYGGFFWEVSSTGEAVNDMKQGYGNVHPLFALAQAYSVTQNPAHLEAAWEQYEVVKQRFLDPGYPGGIQPGFSRDFSEIMGVNNVDTFTHWFEALLALYDVTGGEQQDEIIDQIILHGDFLTQHLYHDQAGYADRGYVAYNYDETWQPSQMPYSRKTQWTGAAHATPGHNIELAYLISRAVERGFNPEWLEVANKLIKFCTEYALDSTYGGMLYEALAYDGQPLEGNPDNQYFVWWAQAETARALLHFAVVRNQDYTAEFKTVETLFRENLMDHDYGGLYYYLDAETLAPIILNKGDVWKTNYHYTMFFVEVLRLGEFYPERLAELDAVTP